MLLPAMLEAAKLLAAKRPGTKFFLPVAAASYEPLIEQLVAEHGAEVQLTHENRYALMGLADVAAAASGTVVMEAALMGLPCVSLYRLAPLNYMIGRMLVHVDHFT